MPSQSNPLTADKVPSTPEQFDIAKVIADDLRELGAEDVEVDEHAYVTAHWPASAGSEDKPCLGFCCHIDTAWQSFGNPVHPEVKPGHKCACHLYDEGLTDEEKAPVAI